MMRSLRFTFVGVAALALLAAACGNNDDALEPESASASAFAGVSASEPATEITSDSTPLSESEPAVNTIIHTFGETVIEGTPQRVMTLGFSEQDPVLALGVTPIAVREWFGEFPYATWPWATDELGDGTPDVLTMAFGELNYEAIAGLAPDLIIATHAGITQEVGILSEIAPTIPEAAGTAAFSMSWQEQTQVIGDAWG